ncbi:MAG TPA: hypothetical protein VGO48_01150 [Conexibacter sp.]|jgi:methionine-rich copper-binding protein CopC|nr:hypothetical protein [Conexibacter sp.]
MGASEEASGEALAGARERRRARRWTVALGLVVIAAGLAATLSTAAEHRTGTNGMPARAFLGVTPAPATLCQAGERIPAGTAALRFSAKSSSYAAPGLTLTLTQGGVVRAKSTDPRWEGHDALVVALAQPLRAGVLADVCVRLHASGGRRYAFKGTPTYPEEAATSDGQPLPGRMHVEYLSADSGSWASFVPTIARRLGRGHAWSGASIALLAALLMVLPIALSAWQLSRDDS